MTAKHSIGATVTACSQEKKPNDVPATAPNAKWGNRAVPAEDDDGDAADNPGDDRGGASRLGGVQCAE
jgi:hypothetical protein